MPQASERWFATPMIRPRLPRMRPDASGIPDLTRRLPPDSFLWHRPVGPSKRATGAAPGSDPRNSAVLFGLFERGRYRTAAVPMPLTAVSSLTGGVAD